MRLHTFNHPDDEHIRITVDYLPDGFTVDDIAPEAPHLVMRHPMLFRSGGHLIHDDAELGPLTEALRHYYGDRSLRPGHARARFVRYARVFHDLVVEVDEGDQHSPGSEFLLVTFAHEDWARELMDFYSGDIGIASLQTYEDCSACGRGEWHDVETMSGLQLDLSDAELRDQAWSAFRFQVREISATGREPRPTSSGGGPDGRQ